MDQFDKILEIFETQKEEIANLSSKVNELEKTNSFLLSLVESSKNLPPVCDKKTLESYKHAAILKEETINSNTNQQTYKDSTFCDLTLNASFDDSLLSNDDAERNSSNIKDDLTIKPNKFNYKLKTSKSDEVEVEKSKRIVIDKSVSKSLNLNLKISCRSPIKSRNQEDMNSVINLKDNCHSCDSKVSSNLASNEDNDDNDEEDEDLFNTVIAKDSSINSVIEKSDEDINEKFHYFPKTNEFIDGYKSTDSIQLTKTKSIMGLLKPTTEDLKVNENLCKALDFVIETLKTHKGPLVDGTMVNSDSNLISSKVPPDETSSMLLSELMKERDNFQQTSKDEHSKLKLLLTTQQMKADILHRSLSKRNEEVFRQGVELIQNNTSNKAGQTTCDVVNSTVNVTQSNESEREINSSTNSSILKSLRQKELLRINNLVKNEQLDYKVQMGFIKFTALIKGYLVRILLQTDRVRNIIITIKDTAQMALSIRQERLSGDCQQPHEAIISQSTTPLSIRRTQQEALSFQSRLGAQLRTALRELHQIFFEWSSADRVLLVQRHIDRLISVATNQINQEAAEENVNTITNSNDPVSNANESIVKPKQSAPPTSATMKRRQNLANRQSAGNVKQAFPTNAFIKPKSSVNINRSPVKFSRASNRFNSGQSTYNTQSSTATNRKSTHSFTTRSRGHVNGSNVAKSAIGTSRFNHERKSSANRPSNTSRRRSATRTKSKLVKHETTTNIQSNTIDRKCLSPTEPESTKLSSLLLPNETNACVRSNQPDQVMVNNASTMLSSSIVLAKDYQSKYKQQEHKASQKQTQPKSSLQSQQLSQPTTTNVSINNTNITKPTTTEHGLPSKSHQIYNYGDVSSLQINRPSNGNYDLSKHLVSHNGDDYQSVFSDSDKSLANSQHSHSDNDRLRTRTFVISNNTIINGVSTNSSLPPNDVSRSRQDNLSRIEVDIDGFDYNNNNNNSSNTNNNHKYNFNYCQKGLDYLDYNYNNNNNSNNSNNSNNQNSIVLVDLSNNNSDVSNPSITQKSTRTISMFNHHTYQQQHRESFNRPPFDLDTKTNNNGYMNYSTTPLTQQPYKVKKRIVASDTNHNVISTPSSSSLYSS